METIIRQMSSRDLEDRQQEWQDANVAKALGLTVEEVQALVYEIDEDASEDGQVYGLLISFKEGSDKGILERICGLDDSNTVRIAPWEV